MGITEWFLNQTSYEVYKYLSSIWFKGNIVSLDNLFKKYEYMLWSGYAVSVIIKVDMNSKVISIQEYKEGKYYHHNIRYKDSNHLHCLISKFDSLYSELERNSNLPF